MKNGRARMMPSAMAQPVVEESPDQRGLRADAENDWLHRETYGHIHEPTDPLSAASQNWLRPGSLASPSWQTGSPGKMFPK
jgi:hypothetical protein